MSEVIDRVARAICACDGCLLDECCRMHRRAHMIDEALK